MLLCGVAGAQDWKEQSPNNSTLHIEILGGDPDEFWTLKDQKSYATFRCHYGWWDDYRYTVETDYCWTSKLSS